MKLRFLGQTYSTSSNQIQTEVSQETACFRGQTYNLRRPVKTFKSELGVRKYRGVVYGG